MKNISLFKNTFYALLLQLTTMLFPLVTSPYISRVIGASNLGKVNFSSSVVNWFLVFAIFGTTTYGVREVSRIRDDKHKLSQFFNEILFIKVIITIVTILVYIPCIFLIGRFSEEALLFSVQGVALIINIFSLDWFFQGIEDYKYITIRSISFKILSIIALFLFVKVREDYVVYAGISIFALSFSNILNFFYARKYIDLFIPSVIDTKKHLKALGVFFLSSLVISVYGILDQIYLGFIRGDIDVAFFNRSKMIYNLGVSICLSLSNVIMPRINNYFLNDKDKYRELLNNSVDIILWISIPASTGIAILADKIIYLFAGVEFADAAISLIVLAPLITMVPLGVWNYQQRIIPLGYEKFGLFNQLIVAFISLLCNLLLIPHIGHIGTAISYLLAESIGTIISLVYVKRFDKFTIIKRDHIKYVIAALGMTIAVKFIDIRFNTSWSVLVFAIVIGVVTYVTILLFTKDNITMRIMKNYFKVRS
ncbi:oligosaccharide flippase family protein [Alloiococcus sp. CFN-8]|uniref:oligosaccharide flippase family protein n=1 Tax=Alloiococcus sp. CFN-8 TaxID=3416081 RepID=UPI003CF3BE99